MKILFVSFLLFISSVSALPLEEFEDDRVASPCNATDCVLPGCRCSGTSIPGGIPRQNTPQFVLLTFDDAVTITNINYYRDAIYGRVNPNGCPISATFFATHEYTDYTLVNELFTNGQEMGLHSITHKTDFDYWKGASVELLEQEFADQRAMMSTFAAFGPGNITGIRMPFLQMAGNNQFEMMSKNNFTYDLSWPTLTYRDPGMWPYTLKYRSTHDCQIGICPDESFPNVWVIPMIIWDNDMKNHTCSMIDACINYLDKERPNNTLEWMKTEFLKQYNGNRAPIGLYLHAGWFTGDETRFVAYKNFLDYLETLPEVYIVGASDVIDWIKDPITVSEMQNTTCKETFQSTCQPRSCPLLNDDGELRYMGSCVPCPAKYPWLGNPLGLA